MANYKSIRLEFCGTKIPSSKFLEGVNSFFDLINEISNSVHGKKGEIKWNVSVASGSARVFALPDWDIKTKQSVNKIFDVINNGISTVEKTPQRPAHFNDNALKNLNRIASIANGDSDEISRVSIFVNKVQNDLTYHIVANVNNIIGIKSTALGAVEGRLSMISERKGLRFAIYDDLTDKEIRCYFDDTIIEDVITAFGKRVSVYGFVQYKADGNPISVKVEEFKVFKNQKDLPGFYDILGILKE